MAFLCIKFLMASKKLDAIGLSHEIKKTGLIEGNVFSSALVMNTQDRPAYNIKSRLRPAEASSSPFNVGKIDNNVDQSIASSATASDHKTGFASFSLSRSPEMPKLCRA